MTEDYSEARSSNNDETPPQRWWRICKSDDIPNGTRLHTSVEGRFVTIFRNRDKLSVIDSICHHAGGPMTDGEIRDIEELGVTVVLCPWHQFMTTIDGGVKAYQAVGFIDGKPVNAGWRLGKVVQRPHECFEDSNGIYVKLSLGGDECASDKDACNTHCSQMFSRSVVEANPVEVPRPISLH